MYANHHLEDKPGAKYCIKKLVQARTRPVALKVGYSSTCLKNYNATPTPMSSEVELSKRFQVRNIQVAGK